LRDRQQGWRAFTVEEGLKTYDVLVRLGGGAIECTELFLYTPKDGELALRKGVRAQEP